jgi:hypothetical protein
MSTTVAATLPRTSTTPGKLWLLRAGLVAACLAWGVLATLMVIQHAAAAHNVWRTHRMLMAVGCGWGLTRRLAEYR